MIDYIRIKNEDLKLDIKRFQNSYNISKKADNSTNHKFKIYKRDLQFYEDVDEDDGEITHVEDKYNKYDSYLVLIVNSVSGFTIQGSLRRWWFSAVSANADFNFNNFCKCIKSLAKKIGINEAVLWSSPVSKIEIGANIKLNSKFKNIVGELESFPRRTRFGDRKHTVYFKTKNNAEEIIIYDKLTQLHVREKKISGNVKRKFLKNIFIIRYEIKINTPYKSNYTSSIKTLRHIKENWVELINKWEDTFQSINIIYQLPPKIPKGKKYLNRTDLKNYFIQIAIQKFGGIEAVERFISENTNSTKSSQEKSYFRSIANANIPESFVQYVYELYTLIGGKADKMKKGFYRS